MKVRLENVKLNYFKNQLFTPSAYEEGQDLKYGLDAILVPGSSVKKWVPAPSAEDPKAGKWVATRMDTVMLDLANEETKGKGQQFLDSLENSRRCLRDGNKRLTDAGDVRDGYEGLFYVVAKNRTRPTILDRDKTPLTERDGKPYPGCIATVSIDVYVMTQKNKGAYATLKGVQFVKDGDAFGGGAPASPDEFDDLGVDEPADDLAG